MQFIFDSCRCAKKVASTYLGVSLQTTPVKENVFIVTQLGFQRIVEKSIDKWLYLV